MSMQAQLPLELDHVYIMVAKDAPEVALLQSHGLFFLDDVAVHEGQGTASRFVLFKNMYLELAWVSDREIHVQESARVGSDFVVPENWRELGASPFGVGLHYKPTSSRSLPVVTERHEAQWMPSGTWIDLVPKASIYEPEG